MPFATFIKVREVSSEDNIHSAENLINSQLKKKWKTKYAGEKSAYVILEMTGSYHIVGIDIGNEHSAFVGVLVGKSGCAPEEFKEILITSSLMTPIESKSSNNINRVRCFNSDALVPSVAEEKWSLVKILCTQPFNKHVSYGLSFIKIHISDNTKSSITRNNHSNLAPEQFQNKTIEVLGSLKYRENSSDSESENSFGLFNRWKKSKHNGNEQATGSEIIPSKKLKPLIPGTSNDTKTELLSLKNCINIPNHHLPEKVDTNKKRNIMELETETSGEKKICAPVGSIKDQQSSSKANKIESVVPFNELLKNVVLVISGIQNPDRADLRNKAIALGAKYKADWDDTCTHLICAFKNTPKYNQVKSKGKIVTRSWIEKCYSLRKCLPWRRYALDIKNVSKSESDEEIIDNKLDCETNKISSNTNLHNSSKYRGSNAIHLVSARNSFSSESDTDDEITRIQQRIDAADKNTTCKNMDIYAVSTDEEDYINGKLLK